MIVRVSSTIGGNRIAYPFNSGEWDKIKKEIGCEPVLKIGKDISRTEFIERFLDSGQEENLRERIAFSVDIPLEDFVGTLNLVISN